MSSEGILEVVNVYRAMQPDADGLPRVGRTGRTLGTRVPTDIAPDESGAVRPGEGGMSVNPDSMWNVPSHRRPRGMGRGSTGKAEDRIYSVDAGAVSSDDLSLRPDPVAATIHAFVEPSREMPLERYESALFATRPSWRQDWPL